MTTLRVYKSSLTALPQYKVRVHKASLTAAAPVVTKIRVYKESLTAVAATVVTIAPTAVAGPGESVELVADLLSPGTATWQWRRISGPTVGLNVSGDTATFVAPSLWNADTSQPNVGVPGVSVLVLGVRATIDGIQSAEVRCEVSILPQLSWSRSGTSWVGARVAPA